MAPPSSFRVKSINPFRSADSRDGIAQIDLISGTPPFQIQWDGPVAGEDPFVQRGDKVIENLSAGNYQVSVTDADGCSQTCAFTIDAQTKTATSLSTEKPQRLLAKEGTMDQFNWKPFLGKDPIVLYGLPLMTVEKERGR